MFEPQFNLNENFSINTNERSDCSSLGTNSTAGVSEEDKISVGNQSSSDEKELIQRTSSVSSSSSLHLSNMLLNKSNINQTKIGYIKCLQIFYYHSSNLLQNRLNLQRSDKIKNTCCYLLDIYKLFIKKFKWIIILGKKS